MRQYMFGKPCFDPPTQEQALYLWIRDVIEANLKSWFYLTTQYHYVEFFDGLRVALLHAAEGSAAHILATKINDAARDLQAKLDEKNPLVNRRAERWLVSHQDRGR